MLPTISDNIEVADSRQVDPADYDHLDRHKRMSMSKLIEQVAAVIGETCSFSRDARAGR